MTAIEQILMNRDGMSSDEAREALEYARAMVVDGADPEEVLYEEFGLEPDYVFDLI